MSGDIERDGWRSHCQRIVRRIRDFIQAAALVVLRPPPPDVIEQIEEVMGLGRYDFRQKKETVKCRDAANEK